MTTITVDTYDEQEAYWEALATELAQCADDQMLGYQCMCGQQLTYGDWVDGSDTLYDCPTCGARHNLDAQATDCTGDPLDDEPDDARDVTGWEGGKASYR